MAMQTTAEDVRKFGRNHYVVPARVAGSKTVVINVGEVHKAMGYKSRVPLVATALAAMKFRNQNRLKLIRTTGQDKGRPQHKRSNWSKKPPGPPAPVKLHRYPSLGKYSRAEPAGLAGFLSPARPRFVNPRGVNSGS